MAPPYRGRGGSGGWFRGGRGGDRGTPFKARGDGRGHGGRRGGGRCGMQGGTNVIVEPHHIHEGFFIAKGKKDALLTKNLVPGEVVHGEKRLTVQNEDGTNTEYRILNPFHSKLAAAVLFGVNIWIKPGAKVLYLGPASGTNVSDVSDIVGPTGVVYVVGISHRRGRGRERDLFNMAGWDFFNIAKKRANVVPLIADARHPAKYRMSVGMVDVIFSDIARHDQKRILALNAWHYLKIGGHFVISIKANDVNPLVPAEAVFYAEEAKLHAYQLKPEELVSLDPYVGDHACIVGSFRMPKKDDE